MASIFKQLTSNDVASTKTLLHEAIPLTGTIVSGTYSDENIKNYAHDMFQSVYDYPYLSSSANHIFDITFGYANSSTLSGTTDHIENSKKINIYNQMAQVLVGYDKTGSIQLFDADGDFVGSTDDKMKECVFISFARLLTKDEIKKGSFNLELGTSSSYSEGGSVMLQRISITDASGSDSYFVNSPVGEYGILYATASTAGAGSQNILKANQSYNVGLLYYQAGIAVLTASMFSSSSLGILATTNGENSRPEQPLMDSYGRDIDELLTGSYISSSADAIRTRMYNAQYNNTVELNSTIYFCRANHNEFNYSANPTYLSGSTINVKDNATDPPLSYVTTIGLYSSDNQLLAVGKLSEPLRKDSSTELTLRARLDY
jgi:hypothetical protein